MALAMETPMLPPGTTFAVARRRRLLQPPHRRDGVVRRADRHQVRLLGRRRHRLQQRRGRRAGRIPARMVNPVSGMGQGEAAVRGGRLASTLVIGLAMAQPAFGQIRAQSPRRATRAGHRPPTCRCPISEPPRRCCGASWRRSTRPTAPAIIRCFGIWARPHSRRTTIRPIWPASSPACANSKSIFPIP